MNNNFENLKKAKVLMDDAKKLMTFHDRFEHATKKGNEGRIDKYKKGFNADDRFKCMSAHVYFTAYTGAYGSSSVGSFLYLNSEKELGIALVQYLKNNEEDVIKGVAAILDEKAKSLVVAAKEEVESASALIVDIEDYEPKALND